MRRVGHGLRIIITGSMTLTTATTTNGTMMRSSTTTSGLANTTVILIAISAVCLPGSRRNTGPGATVTGITTATRVVSRFSSPIKNKCRVLHPSFFEGWDSAPTACDLSLTPAAPSTVERRPAQPSADTTTTGGAPSSAAFCEGWEAKLIAPWALPITRPAPANRTDQTNTGISSIVRAP